MSNEGSGMSVTWWWTPDCGYLHAETNPVPIPIHCPDDVEPDTEEPAGQ